MLRLKQYLTPHIMAIVMCILLLFVQAMSDLNLPNMMSDIINVGIQQSGIEHATPEAISADGYTFLTQFMTDDQKNIVETAYTLVAPNLATDKQKKRYPLLDTDAIYILKDTDADTYATLDPIFGEADWTFINFIKSKDNQEKLKQVAIAQAEDAILAPIRAQASAAGIDPATITMDSLQSLMANPQAAAAMGIDPNALAAMMENIQTMQNSSDQSNFSMDSSDFSGNLETMDITQIYAMTPLLQGLSSNDFETARQQAMATPESMRDQTGSVLVKMLYTELNMDTGRIQTQYIIRIGLIMLGLSLLGAIAAVTVGFLASRIAAGAAQVLRRDIFRRVESFSHSEFNQFSTASLITRSTNDITQLQTMIAMGLRMMCYAPIIGVGGIIMALRQSVSMSWVIALAIVVLVCIIALVFALVMPKFKIIQKLVDRLNLVMRENLNGMSVIRAFSNQAFESERFKKENITVTKTNLFVNRAMVFMMPMMMLIMNGVTLLIVWVGAHQIADSTMQVGDMMAFMQYAMQIIMAFLMISMMFIMIPRASVSAHRIADVLETEPKIKDPKNPIHFPIQSPGRLVFDHVGFHYDGADTDVIHNISFTANPGETTAIIGSTGSGKSTLINLIPRFYDVTSGKITLDNTDIRTVTLQELRDNIGYVPQKGMLFTGTIDSNLRYGRPDATHQEIQKAAEIAQAMDFIQSDEAGFERKIAQGGDNVSGGQKQRLSIARALVKKPSVYIFDDSFSALDFKTDSALRAALKDYTTDSTVLIVAQRINTIMNAEQIIVLDEGHMVGKGTHDELMATCSTYQEIAHSQLSEEELAHA